MMSAEWTKKQEGVYVLSDQARDGVLSIGYSEIEKLKEIASQSSLKRARLCAHEHDQDYLHQMIIAIRNGCYIRPHKHLNKVESFHLIDGAMDVIVFSDEGKILKRIRMSSDGRGRGAVFYRLSRPFYHTVVVISAVAVFHEITEGPFEPGQASVASFSPQEDDHAGVQAWLDRMVVTN